EVDAPRIRTALGTEKRLRCREGRAPFRCVVADGGQWQSVIFLKQFTDVAQVLLRPADRLQDIRNANTHVLVTVDQGQRTFVELKTLSRATPCHPELGVELRQRQEIGAAIDGNLVEAAEAMECPTVRGRCWDHGDWLRS